MKDDQSFSLVIDVFMRFPDFIGPGFQEGSQIASLVVKAHRAVEGYKHDRNGWFSFLHTLLDR